MDASLAALFASAAATLMEGCVGQMGLDQATELLRHGLVLALLVAAPVLAVGLLVGLIVSLLQAVTQVQEQTLSFIPKIVAMVACCAMLLPWMGQHLIEYARFVFGSGLMR